MITTNPKRKALIIGIDCYRNGLRQLPSCKKDAEDLCKLLSNQYIIHGNKPIIGSDYQKENDHAEIHAIITSFFHSSAGDDLLLFYFSGHAIPRENEVFLATPQVDPKEPMFVGISLSNLTDLMGRSKNAVCIIDACYSGFANLPESPTVLIDAYNKVLEKEKEEDKYFLLSSQSYEQSFTKDDDNSIYTKYLLKGFEGVAPELQVSGLLNPGTLDDNGYVTPMLLHNYISDRITKEVKGQNPLIKGSKTGSNEIVLFEYSHRSRQKNLPKLEDFIILLTEGRIDKFNEIRNRFPYIRLNLQGNQFIRADFSKANLEGLVLESGVLQEISLEEANLSDTKLAMADLKKSKLSKTNFLRADLRKACLSDIIAPDVIMDDADLCEANLTHAYLYQASMYKANLSSATIDEATLSNATSIETNLSNASLINANLTNVNFTMANLSNSRLEEANLSSSTLIGAQLISANLFRAKLTNAKLHNAKVMNANLSGSVLSGADISYANFTNSILIGCKRYDQLKCIRTNFTDAIIDNNDLLVYLQYNRGSNLPLLVTNKNELRSMLLEKGFDNGMANKIVDVSVLTN